MNGSDSNNTEFTQNDYYVGSSGNYREKRFTNSMMFRVFALIILLALIAIPVMLADKEFETHIKTQQKQAAELSKKWGSEQTLIGPILSIPYVERISRIESQTDSNGVRSSVSKDIFNNKTLMLLPENLRVNANLKDKTLSKGSLQSNVYEGNIELSGNFNLESLPEASRFISIEWDKAVVALGLTNNNDITDIKPLQWDGNSTFFKPGTKLPKLLKQGLHANLEEVATDEKLPTFNIQLSFNGKQSFQFAPLGELSNATIKSDSPKVSINSDVAAASTSNLDSEENFEATWRISNIVRNYPQQWLIEEGADPQVDLKFDRTLVGVNIQASSQLLDKNLLVIKSILPFIIPMLGILFLSITILEFKRNTPAKPKFLHYLVISSSVILMPVILLLLINMTNFQQAYQIMAGTSILLVVIYLMSSLKSFFKGIYILLIMASLYATLYVKLQMPEYTLHAICATGLLIVILMMMVSINIHEDE